MPATDEVWRLHNRKELDCLFFQKFCEEGHYGGRSQPTNTRQGIYCCTPSGRFLASVNTSDPARMARMLRTALDRWREIPKSERYLDYDPATRAAGIQRRERSYPEDGLALRVYSRDLPRKLPSDWRAGAWNMDSLWYRKGEARSVLPGKVEKGASIEWPEGMAHRLIRHNLVDNVRGQTNGYAATQVRVARIRTTITRVEANVVTVAFEGESRTTTTGTWPEKGRYAGMEAFGPYSRGVQTTMAGEAVYDLESKRFTSFELIASGTRWGETRYNFRQDDRDETGIGFVILLDENDPGRRVAPAEMGSYGW